LGKNGDAGIRLRKERQIKRNQGIIYGSDTVSIGLRHGRWQGRTDRRLLEQVGLAALTSGLNETMQRGVYLKNGSKSLVSRVNMGASEVVIKGYRHLGWFHSLRHTVKGSRAQHSWIMANCLHSLGIRTPQPLGYIDEYRGIVLWQSYFLYEYVEGPPLHAVLQDPSSSPEERRRLIEQVVTVLELLSRQGISHGDLKHSNLICRDGRVLFIDLDALRPIPGPGVLRRRRFEKDKARFLRDMGNGSKEGGTERP